MGPGSGAGDRPPPAVSASARGAVPLTVSDRTVVTVAGDIDMISARVLAEELGHHLRARRLVGRPTELLIDLTGVLYVGAAAMAVLADTATRGIQQGLAVTVVAPPGSAAHRVITLTELGDFLRLQSGGNDSLRPAPSPSGGLDMHNTDVDETAARMGACGQLHLPTGRICTRQHGHPGSCQFVSRAHVTDSRTRQRQ